MKLGVYSVRDGAVQAFMPPFFARHAGEAIRSFSDAVVTPDHQFAKHASDYVLFALGSFDDANGLFESYEPVRMVSGNEILSRSGEAPAA